MCLSLSTRNIIACFRWCLKAWLERTDNRARQNGRLIAERRHCETKSPGAIWSCPLSASPSLLGEGHCPKVTPHSRSLEILTAGGIQPWLERPERDRGSHGWLTPHPTPLCVVFLKQFRWPLMIFSLMVGDFSPCGRYVRGSGKVLAWR